MVSRLKKVFQILSFFYMASFFPTKCKQQTSFVFKTWKNKCNADLRESSQLQDRFTRYNPWRRLNRKYIACDKVEPYNQPIIPWGFFWFLFDMGSIMKYCRQIERSWKKENIYYLLTCEVMKQFLGDPVKTVHLLPFNRIFDYIFFFFNTIAFYKT